MSHRPKSDDTYNKARELINHIRSRLKKEPPIDNIALSPIPEEHHLKLTEQKLDGYYKLRSDKQKTEVINDFRNHFEDDLKGMIRNREAPPDSSIEQ